MDTSIISKKHNFALTDSSSDNNSLRGAKTRRTIAMFHSVHATCVREALKVFWKNWFLERFGTGWKRPGRNGAQQKLFRGTGPSAIGELCSLPPAAVRVPRSLRLVDEWRLPYLAPIKVPFYTRLHLYCMSYCETPDQNRWSAFKNRDKSTF